LPFAVLIERFDARHIRAYVTATDRMIDCAITVGIPTVEIVLSAALNHLNLRIGCRPARQHRLARVHEFGTTGTENLGLAQADIDLR
jgi:hypothetical protein